MAATGSLHESTASIVNRRNIIDCNKLAAPGLQVGGNTCTSSDSLQQMHYSKDLTSRNSKQFQDDGVGATIQGEYQNHTSPSMNSRSYNDANHSLEATRLYHGGKPVPGGPLLAATLEQII